MVFSNICAVHGLSTKSNQVKLQGNPNAIKSTKMLIIFGSYLPQHECSHDKRAEDGDKAENGRRVKTVDARYVAGTKERRQQEEYLNSMLSSQHVNK